MSVLTIAEDESRLPELIDRMLGGDEVVISRRGRPVAQLRPLAARPAPLRVSEAGLAWLDANPPVGEVMPVEDAGAFVSRMRDEDGH